MDNRSAVIIGVCIIIASLILILVPRTGRYAIASSSGVNVFVIDTKSGQLYTKFVPPASGSTNWHQEKDLPWK